jgi:hypothetical protein
MSEDDRPDDRPDRGPDNEAGEPPRDRADEPPDADVAMGDGPSAEMNRPDGDEPEEASAEAVARAASETTTDGQTGVESQVALAQIERVSEDVREKAASFEAREEALRERLTHPND